MGPIMQAISSASLVVVIWYGGSLLLRGELTPGGLLGFLRALARLTWPLMALGFLVGILQRGRAAYSRLLELYAAQPEIIDGTTEPEGDSLGRIEARSLSFSYGNRPVLYDISFALEPGASLAIVGRTGSGKSTLAALLARLLPVEPAMLFVDGVDVCELPASYVRKSVGYAQQTAFLFSTTAARNIGFAIDDPDATEGRNRIELAANDAQILEELRALPEGLDTIVGERGVQLSGGQKQRIALARAFVYRPKVLLLDDPLSAVDARTEKAILDSIDAHKTERSLILVTHRVAAAARCERVLVLEKGRVVQLGTHETLMKEEGPYRAFAAEQQRETAMAALGSADEFAVGSTL